MNKINTIVINCIREYVETEEMNIDVNENTKLFGDNSGLDSMGLVNIIIDIETKLAEEDINITLTSENAMSRSSSPFRSVSTLTEYIQELIGENDE